MSGQEVPTGSSEPLYLTFAQPELHPSRIGAVAALSGFAATPPSQCSFLELGCGDGGNLIPLAESYPSATFVGVDLDSRAIQLASTRVKTLGLTNVQFTQSDLLHYPHPNKKFDYIVCHGVYSWVPESVQRRVFELISSGLSDNGLGYVSYNVLPGWRQRGVLRDIMGFGVSLNRAATGKSETEEIPAEERLKAGAQFLTFISSVRQSSEDLYGAYLAEAISRLQHADLPYLVNEYLGKYNEPCTFLEFMERAESAGLQYVGEARPAVMFTEDLGERVDTFLLRSDVSAHYREQVLDFCRNRMFRETILCRKGAVKQSSPLELTKLPPLFVSSDYTPTLPLAQMKHRSEVPFVNAVTGRETTVEGGDDALVLALIGSSSSGGLSLEQLQTARKDYGLEEAFDGKLRGVALKLLKLGLIDIWAEPLSVQGDSKASLRLSRYSESMVQAVLAEGGGSVTTAAHRTLPLSEHECALLLRISGGKTIAELVNDPVVCAEFGGSEGTETLLLTLLRRGVFCR